jgi:hypothetical protein
MAEIVVKLINGELAGKTAQSIAKELNAAAAAAKKAEIGTKEWIDAHARLDKAKALQQDITKQLNSTKAASDQLKAAWNQLPGAQFFNQISDSLGIARSGVGGLISSMGLLKGAIASTGIGLLVLAVAALITWVTKLDEGMDFLEDRMTEIKSVFEVVTSRLSEFRENIRKLVTNPLTFFKEMASDIGKTVEANQKLLDGLRELEDENALLEISAAKADTVISKLLLQSKNIKLSYEERLGLLKEVDEIETGNYAKKKELADKELKLYEDDYRKRLQLNNQSIDLTQFTTDRILEMVRDGELKKGTATDDYMKKYIDALVKKERVDKEYFDLSEKIENRRAQIEEKRDAERERLAAAEKKRLEDLQKAAQKKAEDELALQHNIESLKVQAMKESLDKEIAQINLDTQFKIEALKGTEEQITLQRELLETDRENRIQAVRDRFAAEQAEKDKKAKDEQLKRDEDAANEKLRVAEMLAETEAQINNIRYETARDLTSGMGDLLASQAKNEKEARRIRKTFAVADIALGLQQELAANAAAGAKISAQAPPASIPGGIAYTVAANIKSIIRAAIATAKVAAFRRGGRLIGPSHEQQGIPFTVEGRPGFEAEGDEILLTKGVWRNTALRSMASAINVAGGGVRFDLGGPVNPFNAASGTAGSKGGSDAWNVVDPFESFRRLEQKFEQYAERVDHWASTLNVQNNLQDTEEGLSVMNRIRTEADV